MREPSCLRRFEAFNLVIPGGSIVTFYHITMRGKWRPKDPSVEGADGGESVQTSSASITEVKWMREPSSLHAFRFFNLVNPGGSIAGFLPYSHAW